ncbi:D-alanyl-D-alanine carboxypeptidase [Actinacidiphila sp. bgisy145]|uniref:D-alanyl-D-alanine carboxypeptidase family protein n=1 Tax=Actinacidiphila sp. bgisy145 TaxID=3413792 RepID=UPI003EB805B3
MAGDAPGREQQHETSGEPGIRPAKDPRLAVFRLPPEAAEARVAEGGAGRPAAEGEADTPGAHTQDDIEDAGSEPRPHPDADSGPAASADRASGRTPTGAAATTDDVADVDTVTDPAPPAAPPAPRTAQEKHGKTEPNRDRNEGAGEAAATSGTGGSDGVGPGSGEPEAEPGETADEAADGAADESADGVVGEDTSEDARVEEDGSSDAEADEDAEAATAESGADETAAAAAEDEGGSADADGAADAAAEEPPAGTAPEPATESAADSDASADADAEARPATRTDAESSRKDGAQDGESPSADEDAPKRPGPTVKPLVSDIPAEWPEGPQGGRQRPSGDSTVVFGAPGRPTRAQAAPPPPPLPPAVPAKPAGKPADAPAAEPAAKPAGQPADEGGASDGATVREPEGPQGTRRMPLPLPPDKQPLKLLAELTNTPPPPETPLRTVLRRFKIWTPLVVLLAVVFVVVQAVRPLPSPHLTLTASPTFTFSGTPLTRTMPWPSEGQSVAEVEGLGSLGVHGKQTPVPIASLTKVMTAYVILHDHPLSGSQGGPTITVDAQAAKEAGSDDQSTAPVKEGQRFDERRMLQLLLIPSGNNIARLLARWDAGTQEAFVAKMTATAKRLGMAQTTYTGASGIEETTVSTSVDQLKLAREVMKNDVFRSVVALPNVDIPGVGRIYNNNNDLVKVGVVGIKTGSSTPAGGALMWAAHKTVDGKQQLVLGVVLQQRGGTTVDDSLQTALTRSQALIESVQGGLGSATVVKKGTVVGTVDDGLGGSTPIVTTKDLTAIGWAGMKQELTLTAADGGVPHHAAAGTEVGTLSLGTGAARTTVPVALGSDLSEPGFGAKLTHF